MKQRMVKARRIVFLKRGKVKALKEREVKTVMVTAQN